MTRHQQPRTYGVLVGDVRDGQIDPTGKTPHYEIWVVAGGQSYRAAVNVISQDDSEVLAYFDPTFAPPGGFTPLKVGDGGAGLDYVKDNISAPTAASAFPPNAACTMCT